MGKWLKVLDVKSQTAVEALKTLPDDAIEAKIIEAEAELNSACGLDVETFDVPPWTGAKDVPRAFRGTFEVYAAEEQKFYAAARLCALMILDRLAQNPREYGNHSVKGASASFGPRIPSSVFPIMEPWMTRSASGLTGVITR